jgi:hypothetical protein
VFSSKRYVTSGSRIILSSYDTSVVFWLFVLSLVEESRLFYRSLPRYSGSTSRPNCDRLSCLLRTKVVSFESSVGKVG